MQGYKFASHEVLFTKSLYISAILIIIENYTCVFKIVEINLYSECNIKQLW